MRERERVKESERVRERESDRERERKKEKERKRERLIWILLHLDFIFTGPHAATRGCDRSPREYHRTSNNICSGGA